MVTDTGVRTGVTILRVAVASVFVIHGVARAALGIVDDFGGFFAAHGIPAGVAIAWAVTIIEVVGGLALAAGVAVRPLSAWFALQILAGIATIHGRAGWFVVGAGRNGAEYSALIVVCLVVVVLTDPVARGLRRATAA